MPLKIVGTNAHVETLFMSGAVHIHRGQTFSFRHGIESPGVYINCRALQSDPRAWDHVVNSLCGSLKAHGDWAGTAYDVVASVASGGLAFGIPIARHGYTRPHISVKKREKDAYGLSGLIDGNPDVLTEARVLLVEDTSTTFKSSRDAMRVLEEFGAEVCATIMVATWELPVFTENARDSDVRSLCRGVDVIDYAKKVGLIDDEYYTILRRWLEDPSDTTWQNHPAWNR